VPKKRLRKTMNLPEDGVQFGTQLCVSRRNFKTPRFITDVVHATSNTHLLAIDSAVPPLCFHIAVAANIFKQYTTPVRSFLQERSNGFSYPVSHLPSICQASRVANPGPQQYAYLRNLNEAISAELNILIGGWVCYYVRREL
jgi:hypothetical protein